MKLKQTAVEGRDRLGVDRERGKRKNQVLNKKSARVGRAVKKKRQSVSLRTGARLDGTNVPGGGGVKLSQVKRKGGGQQLTEEEKQ